MLVIYLATAAVIWLVFGMVSGLIDRVRLKEFDRQLGGIFGAIKGVLWCVVITFFAVTLSESTRQAVLKSRSGYYIAVFTHRAAPMLPPEARSFLGKYIEELDRQLDPESEVAAATGAAGIAAEGVGSRADLRRRTAGTRLNSALFPGNTRFPTEHKRHYRTLEGVPLGCPLLLDIS